MPRAANTSTGCPGCGTSHVGHGRGELADAASGAVDDAGGSTCLGYIGATKTSGRASRQRKLSPRLSEFRAVLFHDRSAESNEFSFKLRGYDWKVKNSRRRTKIISAYMLIRRWTIGAMSATGMEAYHKMFGPRCPGFIQVAQPYADRWRGNEEPGSALPIAIEKAILAEGPGTVAAVTCRTVMGRGGCYRAAAVVFPTAARNATVTMSC